MGLHGTLDVFGLTDVLELLAGTAKTGCLRVQGDGGRGTVWVREGAVAAATTDRVASAPLDEVLCDLLRYESGAFDFDIDEQSPQSEESEDLHELLNRAGALLTEWRGLQATVPSPDHQLTLAPDLPNGDDVTVTAQQWPALVAIGDRSTVRSLAKTLGLTELQVMRLVNDLVEAELVQVTDPRPRRSADRAASERTPIPPSPRATGHRLETEPAPSGNHPTQRR